MQKNAAELLGISPRVMNYKIKTLAIDYARGGRRSMQSVADHEYAKLAWAARTPDQRRACLAGDG